jgi:hypothetical protein
LLLEVDFLVPDGPVIHGLFVHLLENYADE